MTGLDTNVLVRYITRDNAEQHRAAKRVLESTCTREHPGYVSTVVLTELVWVLEAAYDAVPSEVARVVDQLLRTRQIKLEHRDEVRRALQSFRREEAGFADCLIGHRNQGAGCEQTVTFDAAAGAMEGWHQLSV
jgi:predicted nucleic-acid-binding protein